VVIFIWILADPDPNLHFTVLVLVRVQYKRLELAFWTIPSSSFYVLFAQIPEEIHQDGGLLPGALFTGRIPRHHAGLSPLGKGLLKQCTLPVNYMAVFRIWIRIYLALLYPPMALEKKVIFKIFFFKTVTL